MKGKSAQLEITHHGEYKFTHSHNANEDGYASHPKYDPIGRTKGVVQAWKERFQRKGHGWKVIIGPRPYPVAMIRDQLVKAIFRAWRLNKVRTVAELRKLCICMYVFTYLCMYVCVCHACMHVYVYCVDVAVHQQ